MVSIPSGKTWAPVQCTFSEISIYNTQRCGLRSNGRHLVYPQLVNQWGRCRGQCGGATTVPRHVSRDTLATCTGLCRSSLTLGGVPSYALDAEVEIRNGDVVFGDPVTSFSTPAFAFRLLSLMRRPLDCSRDRPVGS